MGKFGPTHTIYGMVSDARYYPAEKSMIVVLRDIESNKEVKPVQIHASSFTFPDPTKVDEEMHKTAELMKKCKYPIRIVFDPQSLDEEKAWYGDEASIRKVFGDDWSKYIKDLANLG